MTAPGDVVGHAVVNVRTCEGSFRGQAYGCKTGPYVCPGCQGDGTWVDTSNPTMVERVDVSIYTFGGYLGRTELEVEPDPDGYYFRPVENGDTDGA